MRPLIAIALLAVGITATTGAAPRPMARAAPEFPWQRVGLDRGQLATLERGLPVVKVLDTKLKRDVAMFGIIRIDAARDRYEASITDFPNALQTPTRLRFGIFHNPAEPADVETASLARNDVTDARSCRPGNCMLKLPAAEMQKIRGMIDWSPAADPAGQLNRYLRLRLVEFATDYRARGDSAMLVYDDVGGVHASDAFAALLAQVHDIYEDIPSLQQYLLNYPRAAVDTLRQVIFWAQDSVPGMKSILSVTHEIAYQPPEYSGVTLVAAKQIYAGHFFEAALDLTALVDRPVGAGPPGIYLVVLRLARFDDLPSGPIISVRGKVIGKLRDQMRADLARAKTKAEGVP